MRPKPMVEIGGQPILWHIMKIYAAHGINDFIICLGYKGYVIKEYFAQLLPALQRCRRSIFDTRRDEVLHRAASEPWTVTLVDTGETTQTGGRIKRILPYVADDEAFCLTYGDGVADVDIPQADRRAPKRRPAGDGHRGRSRPAASARSVAQGDRVTGFQEKPRGDGGWINGGFFVCSPKVGDYIDGDATVWEREPLERLAADGQLGVHFHDGFWQPMDTLRDRTAA